MDAFLSIIIPAHNEENRLPHTLQAVASFIQQQPFSSEVIIVENGSSDKTFEVAGSFCAEFPLAKVIQEQGRGKGLAVRRGMVEATGQYRMMCDADLSMPVEQILHFLPPELDSIQVAIASREAPGAVRYNEPLYRHLGGRLINAVIRFSILPGLQDTQCGFKCFRADVAEDLFHLQTLAGWSFDIELLYIARRRGYRIDEVPIPWYYNPESKLDVVQDTLKMLRDIIQIHRNALRGVYG